jgi:hypothetical protein
MFCWEDWILDGTHENKLPKAPPSNTISYLESMGLENDAL